MILYNFVHVDWNVFFVKDIKRNSTAITGLDKYIELRKLEFIIFNVEALLAEM